MIKKILLFLIINILTINIVFAQEVTLYFYTEGATSSSSNVSIEDDMVTLKRNGLYYSTYTTNDYITGFNKIDGETFTLSKNGKEMVPGAEWFAYDKNEKKHYYSQNYSYNLGQMAIDLGVYNDSDIMIDLHANWEKKDNNNTDNKNSTKISLKKLGKIDLSSYKNNCVKSPTLYLDNNHKVSSAQGFTVAGKYYIAAKRNKDESTAVINVIKIKSSDKYDSSPKVVDKIKKNNYFGHANGITYNDKTGSIVIAMVDKTSYKSFDYKDIGKKTHLKEGNIYKADGKTKLNPSAIAYDKSNNKYYLGKGKNLYVYNSNLSKLELHIKKVRKCGKEHNCKKTQDIAAYKGLIIDIRYNGKGKAGGSSLSKTRNAIDIYRAKDGKYLGTYIVDTEGELESLAYNPSTKKFAFYVQNVGPKNIDCIQEKSIKGIDSLK